jgi:hypothetical protein
MIEDKLTKIKEQQRNKEIALKVKLNVESKNNMKHILSDRKNQGQATSTSSSLNHTRNRKLLVAK